MFQGATEKSSSLLPPSAKSEDQALGVDGLTEHLGVSVPLRRIQRKLDTLERDIETPAGQNKPARQLGCHHGEVCLVLSGARLHSVELGECALHAIRRLLALDFVCIDGG